MQQLAQAHRNKQKVSSTFTLLQKYYPVKLKGKERTEEIKFLEGFLRFESNAILGRIRAEKNSQLSALRFQKRAINQLVKGIRSVAKGEKFSFLQNEANSLRHLARGQASRAVKPSPDMGRYHF